MNGPVNAGSAEPIALHKILTYIEEKAGKKAIIKSCDDKAPFNGMQSYSLSTAKAVQNGFTFALLASWLYPLLDAYIFQCKEYYPDFADEYLTDGKETGACSLLKEGDEFIFEGSATMPEGFCPWAWIDIYHGVSAISSGSTYTPWNRKDGQTIVCCTDGIRLVVFRIEVIGDDDKSVE